MEGALRGVRLCPTQQQAPSPPHLACPLLAVPFLVPWRANHPTRAEMAAPSAHRLARPTLRAHSYRTGSPGRAMQLSPWVHAQRHASPMWGSGPSRNTSCSLAHHGQSWGGGVPGSARRVAMASVAASPVGLHCLDVTHEVLGQADTKDL